jgi:hypothetical protein
MSLARWATAAWDDLSTDERRELGVALRDRCFALMASRREDPGFHAIVARIDPPRDVQVDGLAVTFHPTARNKAIRFVEAERLPEASRALFARPSAAATHLAAVFVDPAELSYRTYENIVPLDRVLGPLQLELRARRELAPRVFTFEVHPDAATRAALAQLDELGLYVQPLNASTRGGTRFIFHSAALGEALTRAVRAALPEDELSSLSHVNPVFRCNRFERGDGTFPRHLDTPYYDRGRLHASELTLLIYLTGGHGSPALSIDKAEPNEGPIELADIAPLTCVIFDQRLAHEGAAFDDGRKVFLRTELVFEQVRVDHDPAIGRLFAQACYLTAESVFAPELARHADAAYTRVAAAHWRGLEATAASEPLLHKQLADLHFITNGCDFWFPKRAVSLPECAALVLFDWFNCRIGELAFRARCTTRVAALRSPGELDAALAPHAVPRAEPLFGDIDLGLLFPEPEETLADTDARCCSLHSDTFDATRSEHIVKLYERAQWQARYRIEHAPIFLLGDELFLDRTRFVVGAGRIDVLSDAVIEPLHFAACNFVYREGARRHLGIAGTVHALQPLVPPILFTEQAHTYHLMLDLFRNSWVVGGAQLRVPVPRLHRELQPAAPDLEPVSRKLER